MRDLLDIVDLCSKHSVALVSVSETLATKTANGEFFVHTLGALAQMERRIIGDSGCSLRAIATMLNDRGVQPARGGVKWYASSVRDVLGSRIASEFAPADIPLSAAVQWPSTAKTPEDGIPTSSLHFLIFPADV